jgi:hypothetical protein
LTSFLLALVSASLPGVDVDLIGGDDDVRDLRIGGPAAGLCEGAGDCQRQSAGE